MTRILFSSLLLLFLYNFSFSDTSPKYQLQGVSTTQEAGALNYMIGDLYNQVSVITTSGTPAGLQTQLNNEISDRQNADSNLQGQITINANNINSEASIRSGADINLQNQINATALSTGTFQPQINALGVSTGTIQSQLNTVQVSTVTAGIQVPSIAQYNSTAQSTGTLFTNIQSTYTFLQSEINSLGVSTGSIQGQVTTGFSNVAISTNATAGVDNNQNIAIGNLQNQVYLYGGQTVVPLNLSSGTIVNVDTTTFSPGVGMAYILNFSSNTKDGAFVAPHNSIHNYRQKFVPTQTIYVSSTDYLSGYSGGTGFNYFKLNFRDVNFNVLSSTCATDSNGTYLWLNMTLTKGTTYYFQQIRMNNTNFNFGAAYTSNTNPPMSSCTDYCQLDNGDNNYTDTTPYLYINFNWWLNSSYFSTTVSTQSFTIFNNGAFYSWGKAIISDYQPSGSSITYNVKLSTSGDNWSAIPYETPIVNGSLLPYTSTYLYTEIDFSRTVSTAIPYTNSISYNVNYSPPLLSLSSTNTWTGQNNFATVTIASATVGSFRFISGNSSMIISATRDLSVASADVSYTGVGFKPTSITVNCALNGSYTSSSGCSDEAKTSMCVAIIPNSGATAGLAYATNTIIWLQTSQSQNGQSAIVKSYDNDGFTLTWTKLGSGTGTATIYFICNR
jgi:hypothetical protein